MMFIELFQDYSFTYDGEHFALPRIYAVNDLGQMAELTRGKMPDQNAFTDQMIFVGLATYHTGAVSPTFGARPDPKRTGKLVYTFAQLTPDLVSTIKFGTDAHQNFSPVSNDKGAFALRCWNRGVERITFNIQIPEDNEDVNPAFFSI
jgi:hypothetical protein